MIQIVIQSNWDSKVVEYEILSGKTPWSPFVHQAWVMAMSKDRDIDFRIWDLAPRFMKTSLILHFFNDSPKNFMFLRQYMLSPITSFKNDRKACSSFKDIGFYDLTEHGVEILPDVDEVIKKNLKVIIAFSLCGDVDRKKLQEIRKYYTSIENNKKFNVLDEADFGATSENSQKKYMSEIEGVETIFMSGTGDQKIINRLKLDQEVQINAIKVSYPEMMLIAKRTHFIFNDFYLENKLDPKKNKHEIAFLKDLRKNPNKYAYLDELVELNIFQTLVDNKMVPELDSITKEAGDEIRTTFSKINKDPRQYADVHLDIWKKLYGVGPVTSPLNISAITGIAVTSQATQVFTNGNIDKIDELLDLLNNDVELSNVQVFEPIHSENDNENYKGTTNKEAEKYAIDKIKNVKSDNEKNGIERGISFFSKHMAQRSFSVSQISLGIFYQDATSFDTFKQKMSRVLTQGLGFDGNKKLVGNIIDLSLESTEFTSQDYIDEEIAKQADAGGISIVEAATMVYDTIKIWRFDKYMKMVRLTAENFEEEERLVNSIRNRGGTDAERKEIYDLMKEYELDLWNFLQGKQSVAEKRPNITKGAKRDNKKRTREGGMKPSKEYTKKIGDIIKSIINFYYKSQMNFAGIYTASKNMDISEITTNNIEFNDILSFVKTHKKAVELFDNHFGINNIEVSKIVLNILVKFSKNK